MTNKTKYDEICSHMRETGSNRDNLNIFIFSGRTSSDLGNPHRLNHIIQDQIFHDVMYKKVIKKIKYIQMLHL